jgi:hypothetical protein
VEICPKFEDDMSEHFFRLKWRFIKSIPDRDVECDVRLRGDGVVVHVQVGGHLDDVPRARLPVVRQVDVVLVVVQGQAHLKSQRMAIMLMDVRNYWSKFGNFKTKSCPNLELI